MSTHNGRVVAFDFDGTLAFTPSRDAKPEPNHAMIAKLMEHYDQYDFIVIYTARPETDRYLVQSCLESWRVPFDAIVLNKLRYAILYDDRAIGPTSDEWAKPQKTH